MGAAMTEDLAPLMRACLRGLPATKEETARQQRSSVVTVEESS
jgi:hypothetical protein